MMTSPSGDLAIEFRGEIELGVLQGVYGLRDLDIEREWYGERDRDRIVGL